MNLIGSLLKKTFGFFTSKRRTLLLSSFFVFCGTFLVIHYAQATLSEVAITVVGGISYAVVWIIGQCIALVTYCLIAVANYNDFTNSIAISTGWVVLRDIANMFFIIIFLVIAFGTMLGEDIAPQYHYKRTLVRFIMMAILINFSKTIAGFVIDISQVIMMTFVNAFSAAAGGNFLQVMQINQLTALTTYQGVEIGTIDIVGGLLLAVVVALISLVCMVVLTMILVVRIVALWLLVVVSPLAFFTAAVPMNSIQKFYNQWWSMLVQNVMVGPLLAFFIWLSLAVVSADGFAAEMNKVAAGATADKTTLSSDVKTTSGGTAAMPSAGPGGIGTPEIMLKYMIGIALLMGGLALAKQTGAVGASMAGGADRWLRKQGSGFAKAVGRAAYAPVAATGNWSRRTVRGGMDSVGSSVYGGLAKTGLPILSGLGARKSAEIRQRRQKVEGEVAGYIKNLSLDEALGLEKSLSRLPQTDTVKAQRAQAAKVLTGELKFKDDFEYKKDANGDIVKDAKGKPIVERNNRKIFQDSLAVMEQRAKATGDKSYYEAVRNLKESRADLLTKDDRGKTFDGMGALEVAQKVGVNAYNINTASGKEWLAYLDSRSDRDEIYKNAGPKKREAMDRYRESLGVIGYTGQRPETIEDPVRRKQVVKSIGNEVDKLDKRSLTPEVIKEMSSQQIEILLKADKFSVDNIELPKLQANGGELAMKIAEHGSDKVVQSAIDKFGKSFTDILRTKRDKELLASPVSPNGYSSQAFAASKGMLRGGEGVQVSFNVNVDGNFGADDKGTQDMVSFENAFNQKKDGDPLLMLNLKREELKGEVLEIVREAANNKDVLRQLVAAAKTDEQKDVLEKIVREVHREATVRGNTDMTEYIEERGGIRQIWKAAKKIP